MIPITDLVISLGSLGGVIMVIWGASSFVKASRMNDLTHTTKAKEAKDERKVLDDHRQAHHTRITKLEGKLEE